MILKNQFAVVQLDHIKTKRLILKQWLSQFDDDQEQSDLTGILGFRLELTQNATEPQGVVILECGTNTLHELVVMKPNCILINCQDSKSLIENLENVLSNPSREVGSCRLNTVVIENISSFYWEKRCQDRLSRTKWYNDVNQSISKIMTRFNCNVLVTMWDLEFERGFRSKQSSQGQYTQQTISYTPAELFSGCDHIFGYKDQEVFEYIDGSWRIASG